MTDHIVNEYDSEIRSLFGVTAGGTLRTVKGRAVETITEMIVKSAWAKLGGDEARLTFDNTKIRIFAREHSINAFPDFIKKEIPKNKVFYDLGVDIHVCIDDKFVLGIECKAYTENAMLKRILVDFWLLKSHRPDLICCLLQLETFLGGSNSGLNSRIANTSTYTLMSWFPDVDLNIYTLLEGSRNINEPIHQKEHFKPMKSKYVTHAVDDISRLLSVYL